MEWSNEVTKIWWHTPRDLLSNMNQAVFCRFRGCSYINPSYILSFWLLLKHLKKLKQPFFPASQLYVCTWSFKHSKSLCLKHNQADFNMICALTSTNPTDLLCNFYPLSPTSFFWHRESKVAKCQWSFLLNRDEPRNMHWHSLITQTLMEYIYLHLA